MAKPVYVDTMFTTLRYSPPKRSWPYRQACHLFGQDVDALQEMAKTIGLNRSWFQNRPGFPHYDLTASMRRRAVKAGAIEVSLRFTGLVGLKGWDAALADVGGPDILEASK